MDGSREGLDTISVCVCILLIVAHIQAGGKTGMELAKLKETADY